VRLEKANERRQIDSCPGLGHHDGAGALAQPLVRIRDDRYLRNSGMTIQQRFDLHHRNILAATDDHVLAAAADADVAALVDDREIAGVEPALLVRRVEVPALEVAAEPRAGAHEEPTRYVRRQQAVVLVHDSHFHTRQRRAIGRGSAFVSVIQMRERHRAQLRHAPRGNDLRPQRRACAIDQRAGNRRART